MFVQSVALKSDLYVNQNIMCLQGSLWHAYYATAVSMLVNFHLWNSKDYYSSGGTFLTEHVHRIATSLITYISDAQKAWSVIRKITQ